MSIVSIECDHGSFSNGCPDCRMDRIEALLERIADELERSNEREGYARALERWQMGQGKHPDD